MFNQKLIVFLISLSQCLSLNAWALGFSATGEKIQISACEKQACYSLYTNSILTSQFSPVWSLSSGELTVQNQTIKFESGVWDQLARVYLLKSENKEFLFDMVSGKIQTGL